MALAKEQIRQIITENNFTNVADVYAYLKEGFKDILQELMETEIGVVQHQYDVWEQQDFLQTTEGHVVHYGYIEKFIRD